MKNDVFGFNSRSRKGATSNEVHRLNREVVSIHAPVRERQNELCSDFRYRKVSIHAPVRERRIQALNRALKVSFNSRSRKGATV